MSTVKETILENACAEFSRMGFSDARMDIIAENSGVNRVTVFRNFETKDNLFHEVLDHYVRELSINDLADPANPDPEEGLLELCISLFQWIYEHKHSFRIEIQAAGLLETEEERFSALFADRISAYLQKHTAYTDKEIRIPALFLSDAILVNFLHHNKNMNIWEIDDVLMKEYKEEMKGLIAFLMDGMKVAAKRMQEENLQVC